MSADVAVVELLTAILARVDAEPFDPDAPETWTVDGQPLVTAAVHAVRAATPQEWVAAVALVEAVDGRAPMDALRRPAAAPVDLDALRSPVTWSFVRSGHGTEVVADFLDVLALVAQAAGEENWRPAVAAAHEGLSARARELGDGA